MEGFAGRGSASAADESVLPRYGPLREYSEILRQEA